VYNHAVNNEPKYAANNEPRFVYNKCNRCNTSHPVRSCPAYGKQCRNCGQFGHFNVCCRRKPRNQKSEQAEHSMSNANGNEIHGIQEEFNRFNINTLKMKICNVHDDKELFVIIYVNNVPVKFKVDTGSCVNIIPEFLVNEFSVRFEKTHAKFVAFGGSTIKPVGKFSAECKKNNIVPQEEFYICKSDIVLLGLKTIINFKIVHICVLYY
jgi:hypothetical protein